MMKNEIPIRIYKKVHTGPKTHEGGLKKGALSVLYQVLTESNVKKAPRRPANWQIIIEIINFTVFDIFLKTISIPWGFHHNIFISY